MGTRPPVGGEPFWHDERPGGAVNTPGHDRILLGGAMTQTIDQTPPPAWQAPTPPPPPGAAGRPWYRMKRVWIGAVVGLMIIGAAGGGSDKKAASNSRPLPTGSDQAPATTATSSAPTTAPTAAPVKMTPTTAKPAPTTTTIAVSSCDRVREALLTGSQAQINAAMAALQADRTADATAREYADYYLHRDAPPAYGSKNLRDMDVSLIRMSCS